MSLDAKTNYGQIKISDNAIAILTGVEVCECYGVVGVVASKITDGINDLLKKENYAKGVKVKTTKDGVEIDLYVVLSDNVKISSVVNEIQKRVKYTLEKNLDIIIKAVNVHVMGIKVS